MVKENEDDQKCYMCTMWQKGKSLDLFKNFLNFRNSYDFINQGNSSHLTKYKNVIGFFFHRSKSIIVGSFKIKIFVCIFKEIQFPFFGDQEALKLQSNVKCCPRAKWRNCKVVHRPSKHCFMLLYNKASLPLLYNYSPRGKATSVMSGQLYKTGDKETGHSSLRSPYPSWATIYPSLVNYDLCCSQ